MLLSSFQHLQVPDIYDGLPPEKKYRLYAVYELILWARTFYSLRNARQFASATAVTDSFMAVFREIRELGHFHRDDVDQTCRYVDQWRKYLIEKGFLAYQTIMKPYSVDQPDGTKRREPRNVAMSVVYKDIAEDNAIFKRVKEKTATQAELFSVRNEGTFDNSQATTQDKKGDK